MQSIKTIVIPAAGAGTRLHPITHVTPKEILRLVDKPIAYYLIQEAYQAGIRRVIFIVHKKRPIIKNFLKSKEARKVVHADFPGLKFSFIETTRRLGDGQAIYEARNLLRREKAFAATMGDLISLPGTSLIQELKEIYNEYGIPVISVEKIDKKKSKQYGVIDPRKTRGRIHEVRSIIEKPEPKDAPSNFAMTGKYILTPKIFDYLARLMKSRKKGEEVKLSNALRDFAMTNELYAFSCKHKHFDIGTKIDLLKTELIFALEHPEFGSHLKAAVRGILRNAGKKRP